MSARTRQVRRKRLEHQAHLGMLKLTQLEEINSKLGGILLILSRIFGEEKMTEVGESETETEQV